MTEPTSPHNKLPKKIFLTGGELTVNLRVEQRVHHTVKPRVVSSNNNIPLEPQQMQSPRKILRNIIKKSTFHRSKKFKK